MSLELNKDRSSIQPQISSPIPLLKTGKGLDRSYTILTLKTYLDNREKRNFAITATVGCVVGVAIGVALLALSCIALIAYFDKVSIVLFSLSVANASSFGILPGLASGFGVFGLGQLISEKIIPYFDGLKQHYKDFKAQGNDKRETPVADIKYILKKVNDATRQELINKMNFEQLSAARQALGDKVFKRFLDKGQDIGHVAWKGIYQLGACKDVTEFSAKIKNRVFSKYINEEPSFKQALLDYLKTLNHHKEFKDILQPAEPIPQGPQHSFNIDDQTITISEAYYNEYCEGALRQSLDKSLNGESQDINAYEGETDLKQSLPLYLRYIGGQITEWDKPTLTTLVDFCCRRWQSKLLSKLDKVIFEYRSLFNAKELSKWAMEIKEIEQVRQWTATLLLQEPINDRNWSSIFEYQKTVNNPALKEKCSVFAFEKLKSAARDGNVKQFSVWIKRYHDTQNAETFARGLTTINRDLIVKNTLAWDALWQEAQKCGLAPFKKLCAEVAFHKFKEVRASEWLVRSLAAGEVEDLRLLIKQVSPTTESVKPLYDAFEQAKKDVSKEKLEVLYLLKQACLTFCERHKDDLDKKIYTLWPLIETPNEIADILYD